MARTTIGLFDRLEDANDAVAELNTHGFVGDQVSVVTRQPDGAEHVERIVTPVGKTKCASAGGIAGGLAGIFTALGLMVVPGLDIGVIMAAGPIVALLASAGAGMATGGLIGALIGMGVSEREAEVYHEGVRRGGALVSVTAPENQTAHISSILTSHGATDIDQAVQKWESSGWSPKASETQPVENPRRRGPEPQLSDTNPNEQESIYTNRERSTSARIYNP